MTLGWRYIFLILAAWGTLLFLGVLASMPETRPETSEQQQQPQAEQQQAEQQQAEQQQAEQQQATSEDEDDTLAALWSVLRQSSRPWGLFFLWWLLIPVVFALVSCTPFVVEESYGGTTATSVEVMVAYGICLITGLSLCNLMLANMSVWSVTKIGIVLLAVTGISWIVA